MSTLTNEQIVQAWRDPRYRESLTVEQIAEFRSLSEEQVMEAFASPELTVELTDDELESVAGGIEDISDIGSCNIASCW